MALLGDPFLQDTVSRTIVVPFAEVRCPHSKELALEQFDLSQEKRDDFLPRLDKTLSLQALGSPWPLGAEAQVGCQEDAPSTKVSPLCPR